MDYEQFTEYYVRVTTRPYGDPCARLHSDNYTFPTQEQRSEFLAAHPQYRVLEQGEQPNAAGRRMITESINASPAYLPTRYECDRCTDTDILGIR